VRRFVVVERNILLDSQSSVLREEYDLKKRGKILKEINLCALIRVR
jgi:hypothetical protein